MAAKITSSADTTKILSPSARSRELRRTQRTATAAGYDAVATDWHASRQHAWGEFSFLAPLLASGQQILDAGCGNGRLVSFLESQFADLRYLGVDVSRKLLEKAQEQHPGQEFQKADLVDLKLEQQFDLVTCVAVLHHLPRGDQLTVLRNLRQHLAPGGRLFLTVWNLWQPRYLPQVIQSYLLFRPRDCRVPFQKKWNRQVWAFTVSDLLNLLEEVGFSDIDVFGTAGEKKAGIFTARNITAIARA